MMIFQMVFEWLVTLIEIIMYFSIVKLMVLPRYPNKKQMILKVLIYSAIVTGVILLNMISITLSLPTLLFSIFSMACGSSILYRGRFREFVFVAVCFVTGLNFIEGMILFTMQNIGFSEAVIKIQQGFSNTRIYVVSVMKVIDIIAATVIGCLLKKLRVRLKASYMALFSAVLGFLIFLYWSDQVIAALDLQPFQGILGICCIFIICSGYFYIKMGEIKKEKDDTAFQNQILEKNYKTAEQTYEANARLYHDMRNHFSLLQRYLAEGKITEAQEYLGKINSASMAYAKDRWTGIDVVDYILGQKFAMAKKEGIQIEIHAEYPKDCKIEPMDLCAILTNLLDNGIESCAKQPDGAERRLKVTIRRIHQFILIKIVNSSIYKPLLKDGQLVTSKKDSRYHGWGMRSVKAAVEKYDGTLEFDYEDSCFRACVMLFYS
jgi:sensor histidine kinase YesM